MRRSEKRKRPWRQLRQSMTLLLMSWLVTKRKQLDDKKVLEAYHAGDKTADEIVAFIQESKSGEREHE